MKEYRLGRLKFVVLRGDITQVNVDAIVVPANSLLVMGGGVAGAVKRRGGDEIEKDAMRRGPIKLGEAVTTSPGKLPVRGVIHAPTMERPAGETSPEIVYLATRAAVREAERNGFRTIAFPGMGTGVGGLSPLTSAEEMVKAILDELKPQGSIEEVYLVAFEEDLERAFVRTLESRSSKL